ncbi:15584_t:CDS:2 [Cetraspora pellucida]|uniref:Lysophospholipid acyltransferase 5 n=1 Tax=Cetraspora pellucida TaxID=1433469 RepID=A0A9N8ZEL0_9GLOM|nr:15584_t:CDS:2 [Cetraspora pellucida]
MFVKKLSVETGVSEQVLRLLLTILFAYPISLIYRLTLVRPLKTKWAPFIRNLYVVITGLSLSYFFNGHHIKHSLITTIVTWLFCYLGSIFRNRVLSAIASFLFNVTYLLVGYYMTATDDYDVSWTMPQCVLCLRMIGFAMDFMDGEKLLKSKPPVNVKENITNTNEKNTDTKKVSQQTDSSISTRPQKQPISFEKNIQLGTLPPLIETIGYANFFGSFLIGPQFSFHLYRKFITMSLYPDPSNIPPRCYWFALKSFLLGALYLGVQQVGSGYFPQSYLLTAEYAAKPFIHKLIIMWWTGKFILSKYLGIWTLSEGACILSGISFNGYDDNGNPKWDGLSNIEKWNFEFATSLTQIITSFNTNTNLWTKLYIFKRLVFLGNKQLSSILSLVFLALWHGLHSGYYFCFSLEFFDIEAEKRWAKRFERYTKPLYLSQNNSNPKIMFGKYLHLFIGWFGQTCALHYAIISFGLLKWDHVISAYNSVYWIGHLTVFGLLLFDIILPKPKTKKVDKETNGIVKVDKESKNVNGGYKSDRINGYIKNDSKIER